MSRTNRASLPLGKSSRNFLAATLVAGAAAFLSHSSHAAEVAVFKIVSIELVETAVAGFTEALEGASEGVSLALHDAQGQANLFPTIARQIVRDEPDLIAVIGTPAVLATVQAAEQAGSDVPIIFIAMGDPVGAGIAESLDRPGKQSSGSTDWIPPAETLAAVLAALPEATRIGTIWDPSNQNGRVFHDALAEAVGQSGDLEFVDVSIASPGEVFMAGRSLADRVDAIIIGPDSAIIQGLPALGGVAIEAGIPLIITAGDHTTPGVLMGLGVDYRELGRVAGEIAAEVINGADVSAMPIIGPTGITVSLNDETLATLGIELADAESEAVQ